MIPECLQLQRPTCQSEDARQHRHMRADRVLDVDGHSRRPNTQIVQSELTTLPALASRASATGVEDHLQMPIRDQRSSTTAA